MSNEKDDNVAALEALIARSRQTRESIIEDKSAKHDTSTTPASSAASKSSAAVKNSDREGLYQRLLRQQKLIEQLKRELDRTPRATEPGKASPTGDAAAPAGTSSNGKTSKGGEPNATKREVEGLQRRLARSQKEVEELRRKQRTILASRSWRLTAPLRGAAVMLGGKRRLQNQRQALHRLDENTEPTGETSVRAERSHDLKEKKKHARKRVTHARVHLYTLGFVERGVAELKLLTEDRVNAFMAPWAEWELALWYASHPDAESKRQALEHIRRYRQHDFELFNESAIAIVEAECLETVGERDKGIALLEGLRSTRLNGDVLLGLANLYENDGKLTTINRCLEAFGIERIHFAPDNGRALYDRILVEGCETLPDPLGELPRVTVIVPVYNAESTVDQAMESLLNQTWPNLEVIVADDCSTDATVARVKEYESRFERLVVIRNDENSGPYVARNNALNIATGDFVTCHDADDWSHPRKIEHQARHLVESPEVFANTSQQARAFEDLRFHRRGNKGYYIQFNLSSLMFRRAQALEAIGYWDAVRFAGDSEYLARIKKAFDPEALVHLDTGPLSFQRQSADSLTSAKGSGYNGYKYGARAAYEEFHRAWYDRPVDLYDDPDKAQRHFFIPGSMRPKKPEARHFDVILASDFRLSGGTTSSNAEEIKANHALGLKTAIVQISCYGLRIDRRMEPKIRELVEAGQAELIVFGESVSCEVLVIRQPWVLQDRQAWLPEIRPRAVRVIVNQPPNRDYGDENAMLYNIPRCRENALHYFGTSGVWHPIGPLVRETLLTHHRGDLEGIELSDHDWPNIIDVDEWCRETRPAPHAKIRLCRLSRDHVLKWPATLDSLTQVYPTDEAFEVHVLGGAETVAQMMGGQLPENWQVLAFGAEHPRDFLARHDVFVYYTHPDWVEAFGRVIFEAMAVGVPVFLPWQFEPLFGEAAIYAEPQELQGRVKALMADPEAYSRQVDTAHAYVREHFGYKAHAKRIEAVRSALPPVSTDADTHQSPVR
ncbi:glycosyltransferase [Salinicola halophilus]|uniref:glycosyltransferase n=1 Tax=Salinicola halophilus TaxID=184065 RepID=UPI0013A631E9|nr:glycosyltransferase [Salinicola halophilus]